MIRKYYAKLVNSEKDRIKWRSHEPSRIEAFSDGVFALAVSLLIISLDAPHSSKELIEMMIAFIPFGLCFFVIFGVWFLQYKFFRRYGLRDTVTIVLNGFLLFVVLSYIYPLKFLFSSFYLPDKYIFSKEDYTTVIVLYCLGAAIISFLFMLMYLNAWLKKDELKLTAAEIFETTTYILRNISQVFIMLIFIFLMYATMWAAQKNTPGYQYIYLVFSLFIFTFVRLSRKRRNDLFKKRFGETPMIEPHLGAE